MEAGALHAPAGLSRISIASPLLRLRSDEQLVALFRAGNEEAFQVIFDRYRQRLFAYTRQMLSGSRADAEDALQDVFLRAYAALRANDRPVSLRAWLYRVAHNRCIDQLRRPTPPSADVFDMSRSPLRDPMQETERREDLRRLVEDVQRLPEAQRSALLMREIDGLSYQELADALDVTVPAIKSLLVRARIGLVEAIEARDTACAEIRDDLLSAFDRGVRASGRARRHLRDCSGCRDYKTQLRTVQQGLGALAPSPGPLAVLAKLLGFGGAGGGAVAGGGAAIGGGSVAVVGGATACKVAALVCSAAIVGTAADLRSTRTGGEAANVMPAAAAVTHAGKKAPAPSPIAAPERVGFHLPSTARTSSTADAGAGARTNAAADAATRAAAVQPSAAVAASHTHRAAPVSPNDTHYGSSSSRPATDEQAGTGAMPATDDPLVAGESDVAPGTPSAPTTISGDGTTTVTGSTGSGTTSGASGSSGSSTTGSSTSTTTSGATAGATTGTSAPTASAASTTTTTSATMAAGPTGTGSGSTAAPAPSSPTPQP